MIPTRELLSEYKAVVTELLPLEKRVKALKAAKASLKRTIERRGIRVGHDESVVANPNSHLVCEEMLTQIDDDVRQYQRGPNAGHKYELEAERLVRDLRK